MKLLKFFIMTLFPLFVPDAARAYVVTDVKPFNKIIENGETIHWLYNLADFGFVNGRDSLVGQPVLTFEFRALNGNPDWDDAPFIMLGIDQGRSFFRVDNEDWVVDNGLPFFNRNGHLIPYIHVSENDVWLGNVILTFEFSPGPAKVPEPAPLVLLGCGLILLGLRWYQPINKSIV